MKSLLKLYEKKLEIAINHLEIAKSNSESFPAESEEEAKFFFEKADKQIKISEKRVDDIKEFISDIKCKN
jgi:hypothetical protein